MEKRILKRIVAFALIVCMCLPLLTAPGFAASEVVSEGKGELPSDLASMVIAAVPVTLNLGSVRVHDVTGLRFISEINAEQLEKVRSHTAVRKVEIGTLITMADYVGAGKASAVTFENLQAYQNTAGFSTYLDVKATVGAWYTATAGTSLPAPSDASCEFFSGSILGIKQNHLDEDLIGRAYLRVTLTDGTVHVFYSSTQCQRNVAAVAESALNDTGISWTETQKVLLGALIPENFDAPTRLGQLKDTFFTGTEYFFRLANGIYCRLTHQGSAGWRLQTTKTSGVLADFQNVGAAQALSNYVGETPDLAVDTLTVNEESDMITVTAPDGTSVKIATDSSFIRFCSVDGTLWKSLTAITESNGVTTVTGGLGSGTGVYGGGERFDTVNQRGKTVELYTTDGYNRDDTTYIAIPLFVTSDGCGIFMNRYEPMTFDFTGTDTWKATLQNDGLDLYINIPGNMSEVLLGYSDLTGHATLPAEWAQGVIVLGYRRDLSSLEDATLIVNKGDGTTAGYGIKTIIGNFEAAGLPLPKAVLLEPWFWWNVSNGNQRDVWLQEAIDWLAEKGIKTMLYMRAGEISPDMKGYKEEYLLSAQMHKWVNGQISSTKTVTDIPLTSQDGKNPDVGATTTFTYFDITNPEAMDWYLDTIWGQLIEMGISGVKIDFCEVLPETGTHFKFNIKKGDPATEYLNGEYTVTYNWKNAGFFASGTEHHAYATYFISAFTERMNELIGSGELENDFVVIARGGGSGSQRNPFMWAGDQVRAFENLGNQLNSLLSAGLSGIPFMTYDMAGYNYSKTYPYKENDQDNIDWESRVFARGLEFSAFTPTIMTHGSVRRAYDLNEDAQTIYKYYVTLHDELMPYIRKISEEACDTGMPIVRHLVLFAPNDSNVLSINDEFMLGDAILVAPILTDNTYSRSVYLPAGNWLNMLTGETVTGGKSVTVAANIGQIPVFLNINSEDFESLETVFEGMTWRHIKNFAFRKDPIGEDVLGEKPLVFRKDPIGEDILGDAS